MLNYCGILAVGMALEAMITLLSIQFVPFFMLTWIIGEPHNTRTLTPGSQPHLVNVSVCVFPIEIMPSIYRYGKAAPFYNVSRAMRTIIFGTKNVVGHSFGILIVWIAISCITMPLIQIWARRRERKTGSAPESEEIDIVENKTEV